MLRTFQRDKTPTRTAADPELVEGATELIEAATAEAAIAEVHERLGPDARILEARRDLRGGIGGFFAKEVVRLHAAPGESRNDASTEGAVWPEAAATEPTIGRSGPMPSPVERLLDDAPETVDFATFLRERMQADPELRMDVEGRATVADDAPSTNETPPAEIDPAAVIDGPSIIEDPAVAAWRAAARRPLAPPARPDNASPNEPVATVAPEASAPTATVTTTTTSTTGAQIPGPAWSSERLLHLGIPADLVRDLDLDQDADDLAWTTALARELAAACGPLPGGPALLVGPLADELKGQVDEPTARSQVWFDALRDGRWLHLVVGGEGWRDHLGAGPRVVSWTRPQDLPDAVRCARELGLTLGHGALGGEIRRARPLDVAVAIRGLVDAR